MIELHVSSSYVLRCTACGHTEYSLDYPTSTAWHVCNRTMVTWRDSNGRTQCQKLPEPAQ